VRVKIPKRLLERMPKAGQGRSGFILQALEEKLAAQGPSKWNPTSERDAVWRHFWRRGGTNGCRYWMKRRWNVNWLSAGGGWLENLSTRCRHPKAARNRGPGSIHRGRLGFAGGKDTDAEAAAGGG
jgi:hypothetical protein